MESRYVIQFFSTYKKDWIDSGYQNVVMSPNADVEAVWMAYLNYLSVASPDDLYRLVRTVTTRTQEIIHVGPQH